MPNSNYLKGRRFEYERAKYWRSQGYQVVRTAGSHGTFDLIAFPSNPHEQPMGIQCKVTESKSTCKRLLDQFEGAKPVNIHMHERMEVKIAGSKEVFTCLR